MLLLLDSTQGEHAKAQPVDGLTLGSALGTVRLPEGAETFGAKTLVASLCVLALLRTRAVNLALVHVCVQTSVTVSVTDKNSCSAFE